MGGTGSISLEDRLNNIEGDIKEHKADFKAHEEKDEERHAEMKDAVNEMRVQLTSIQVKIMLGGAVLVLAGNWLIKKYG